jgi:hypothetical protein
VRQSADVLPSPWNGSRGHRLRSATTRSPIMSASSVTTQRAPIHISSPAGEGPSRRGRTAPTCGRCQTCRRLRPGLRRHVRQTGRVCQGVTGSKCYGFGYAERIRYLHKRGASLKPAVASGMSTAGIARKLGVSRNAIISKLHRLRAQNFNRGHGRSVAAPQQARGGSVSVSRLWLAAPIGSWQGSPWR